MHPPKKQACFKINSVFCILNIGMSSLLWVVSVHCAVYHSIQGNQLQSCKIFFSQAEFWCQINVKTWCEVFIVVNKLRLRFSPLQTGGVLNLVKFNLAYIALLELPKINIFLDSSNLMVTGCQYPFRTRLYLTVLPLWLWVKTKTNKACILDTTYDSIYLIKTLFLTFNSIQAPSN